MRKMPDELRTALPTTKERRAAGRALRQRAKRGDRGRDKGDLCPSLRTGLADFRHPALQLVVNFQEDRHVAVRACSKENKPTAEK